jgi:hypothetical protein
LKGRRLWRYVTRPVPKLVQQKDNVKEEFAF